MWALKKKLLPETLLDSTVMSALPVFQQKIVLIGDALSGKSSIVDRYISNKFSMHADATWSVRVGTKSWAISDPTACIVNVELWDTPRGGLASCMQRIECNAAFVWQFGTSLASEQFWRGTRAILVCVDGQLTSCASVATRWLTSPVVAACRRQEPGVVVCLVATKADALSERRAEAIDAELQSFVESGLCSTWAKVSAKDMTGIYDSSDLLKQLLHALVSKDLKAHKSRARRSLIRPRQSVSEGSNRGSVEGGRLSLAGRASVAAEQLKDVAIRFGPIQGAR